MVVFTWAVLGLIEEPEFEAEIPGATMTPDETLLLIRNDFRLAWRGAVVRGLEGNRIEDEAIDVRGDWFGV